MWPITSQLCEINETKVNECDVDSAFFGKFVVPVFVNSNVITVFTSQTSREG